MRVFAIAVVFALLAGCARPNVSADAPSPVAPTDAAVPRDATPPRSMVPGRTRPDPVKSTPLPPDRVDARAPQLVSSCGKDSDCAVKNVGSCCGAMPACVNANSPTNPAAVQAECQAKGMMSTCGFKEIQSCSCVAGTCRDSGATATAVDR